MSGNGILLAIGALLLLRNKSTSTVAGTGPGQYLLPVAPRAGSTAQRAQSGGAPGSKAGGPAPAGAGKSGSSPLGSPEFTFGGDPIDPALAQALLSGDTLAQAAAAQGESTAAGIDQLTGSQLTDASGNIIPVPVDTSSSDVLPLTPDPTTSIPDASSIDSSVVDFSGIDAGFGGGDF